MVLVGVPEPNPEAGEQEHTDPGGRYSTAGLREVGLGCENLHVNYISPTEKIKVQIESNIVSLSPHSLPLGLIVLQTRDSQNCHKAIPINPSISY